MAYQIYYSPENDYKYPKEMKHGYHKWSRIVLCVAILVAFMFCLKNRNTIIHWFLPGNPAQTQASLSDLIDHVREGEPLRDAVTAFCLEIIDNAQIEKYRDGNA